MTIDKTKALNTASKALTITAAGLLAVERLADEARGVLGGSHTADQVIDIAKTLVAIVDTVRDGLTGTASPAEIQASLDALRANIRANDQRMDDAMAAKFPDQ